MNSSICSYRFFYGVKNLVFHWFVFVAQIMFIHAVAGGLKICWHRKLTDLKFFDLVSSFLFLSTLLVEICWHIVIFESALSWILCGMCLIWNIEQLNLISLDGPGWYNFPLLKIKLWLGVKPCVACYIYEKANGSSSCIILSMHIRLWSTGSMMLLWIIRLCVKSSLWPYIESIFFLFIFNPFLLSFFFLGP